MLHATPEERRTYGREARTRVPRRGHGEWRPAVDRADPLDILALQATTRVPELVPIRYGRMAASPFAFYRGAAAVMAADLGRRPHTDLAVQLCGDAHLANFGGFASPERDLVFDVNDFDETLPGPFEWDLLRLAASFEVAGRDRGFDPDTRWGAVVAMAASYRQAMAEFADLRDLEIWYSHLDTETIVARWGDQAPARLRKRLERTVTKSRSKDHLRALARLTTVVDGELRFAEDPPLLVRADDLFTDLLPDRKLTMFLDGMAGYTSTLSGDRRHLMEKYEFVDLARKVVGVGSVGTRCWVALFVGRDLDDPLVLQIKQAEPSVLAPFAGASRYPNQGQRVVEGQRLMQGASDIFLGWDTVVGGDGVARDYYFRQLWDWKVSPDIEGMDATTFGLYGELCGFALARGHARSSDPIAITGYLGDGDRMDRALASFARAYGDQNERDHERLVDAVAAGRIPVETGI